MNTQDQIKITFEKNRQETQQMFLLIAGFNRSTLTDEERDKLDEWVAS